MMVRLGLGFLAGSLAALIGFALCGRAPAAPSAAGEPATDRAGAPPVESPAVLEAEIAALEARLGDRRRSAPAPAALPGAGTAAQDRRRSLARRVAQVVLRFEDERLDCRPQGQWLNVEFQRWLDALAGETGLSPEEAAWSPAGIWAYVGDVLSAMDPPLSDSERQAWDRDLESVRADWQRYLADRPGLSRMERAARTSGLSSRLYRTMAADFTEAHQSAASDAFGYMSVPWPGPDSGLTCVGSRSHVRTTFADAWTTDLGLDPAQRPILEEVVEAFIIRHQAEMAELQSRSPEGRIPEAERTQTLFRLMIAAQKRLRETLGLTEEQRRRLDDWAVNYDLLIEE